MIIAKWKKEVLGKIEKRYDIQITRKNVIHGIIWTLSLFSREDVSHCKCIYSVLRVVVVHLFIVHIRPKRK